MKRSIAAFLIVMSTASLAWAGTKTDLENFQKSVGKLAPDDFNAKGKTLCACFASTTPTVGYLYQNGLGPNQFLQLVCKVRSFDPATGDFSFTTLVCDDFDVIR
jgi:hypothetical protein